MTQNVRGLWAALALAGLLLAPLSPAAASPPPAKSGLAMTPQGQKIYYEVHGTQGPYVFLGQHLYASAVQGLPDGLTQAYIDALSDRYRVIVADLLRGHGKTPAEYPPQFSVQSVLDMTLAVADEVGANRFAWFGYSWGGAIAVQLAARTDRLSAVAVGGWAPLGSLYEATRELAKSGMNPKFDEARRKQNEESVAFYTELMNWNEAEGVARIAVPRLLLAGEKDDSPLPIAARNRENEARLRAMGWQIEWLPGATHAVWLEPARLTAPLRKFLDTALPAEADSATAARPATTRVMLETDAGSIELEIESERAPLTSAEFLRYVDGKLLDNAAAFYRVVRPDNDHATPAISIVQGGLPQIPPGNGVPHESTAKSGVLHLDGTISLPRLEPGSATGAAFFICVGDQPALDAGGGRKSDGLGFAAFGRVVKGMEIVRKIQVSRADTDAGESAMRGQMLTTPVSIRRAYRR